jgi:hypothetical protein
LQVQRQVELGRPSSNGSGRMQLPSSSGGIGVFCQANMTWNSGVG